MKKTASIFASLIALNAISHASADALKPDALLQIDLNRAAVVERVFSAWQSEIAPTQRAAFKVKLNQLRADQLLAANVSGTFDGVLEVIDAREKSSTRVQASAANSASADQAKALGELDRDLLYTPISPCRLLDTRGIASPVFSGGAFAANEIRSYQATGNCTIPTEAAAVVTQITMITPPVAGDIELLPQGGTFGNSVAMVFLPNAYSSVSMIARLNASNGKFDTQIRGQGGHVAMDVTGYFMAPVRDGNGLRVVQTTGRFENAPSIVNGSAVNVASGQGATVLGGGSAGLCFDNAATPIRNCRNEATAIFAVVGGGQANVSSGQHAAVGGGLSNTANGQESVVAGGYANVASGGRAFIGAGTKNIASGPNSVVAGGTLNEANSEAAFIGGGFRNLAQGSFATIGGGYGNRATGANAFLGGGVNNVVAMEGVVVGGQSNSAGVKSSVLGGFSNTANALYSVVGAGQGNGISESGMNAGILAGEYNRIEGQNAAIVSGILNAITASGGFIGAGSTNTVYGIAGAIVAGGSNKAGGGSFVGAGSDNEATSSSAVVAGLGNRAIGGYSMIGGGTNNLVEGGSAFIGGGANNQVLSEGSWSVVAGGQSNVANFMATTVSGGSGNSATGDYSTIPGGAGNVAFGRYSFAAGRQAKAGAGSFVWADSAGQEGGMFPFHSVGADEFSVRARGGVHFKLSAANSSGDLTPGCSLPAGGAGAWSCSSDRNLKEAIKPISAREVLAKVVNMPLSTWQFKGTPRRHLSPMAQDFWSAFGLGQSDTTITASDVSGVALAAIQGLNQKLVAESKAKDAKISALEAKAAKLDSLEKELAAIKKKLGL